MAGGAAAAAGQLPLAAFYFFFYAQLGAMLPYWGLWLASRGYGGEQIGGVFAVLGLSRIVVPLFWGWLADRSGRRLLIIRATTAAALVCFALFPLAPDYRLLLALTALFAIFWHAAMPQFEVVTLEHLRAHGGDYSRVRMWGSVGFVLTVVGIGYALECLPLAMLPALGVLLISGMLLAAARVTEAGGQRAPQGRVPPLWPILRRPLVLALIAICFLSQFSFAPYYGFFSLYLEQHGYSRSQTGLLWALGVVAEIWIFLYAGRMIAGLGARRVMLLAMAATALRWAALPLVVDRLPALLALQCLHLASFGLYHATAIHYIERAFPGRLHGRGQALYSAVSFGAGGAIGSYVAGAIWERVGPEQIWWLAALAGALATAIAARGLREPEPPRRPA